MYINALDQLKSSDLEIQRSAIIKLGEYGSEMVISALVALIKCHHTDQHSRILAIKAAEKLTGREIGNIPEAKCKFVDRYIARRALEEN